MKVEIGGLNLEWHRYDELQIGKNYFICNYDDNMIICSEVSRSVIPEPLEYHIKVTTQDFFHKINTSLAEKFYEKRIKPAIEDGDVRLLALYENRKNLLFVIPKQLQKLQVEASSISDKIPVYAPITLTMKCKDTDYYTNECIISNAFISSLYISESEAFLQSPTYFTERAIVEGVHAHIRAVLKHASLHIEMLLNEQ